MNNDLTTSFVGIDPDPKALAIAARKLKSYPGVQLDSGLGTSLPYEDGSFDYVLSSFVFHHLDSTESMQVTEEARRVLRDGGSMHIVDFDQDYTIDGHINWCISEFLVLAGFHLADIRAQEHWPFGSVSIYSATKQFRFI